MFRSFLGMKPCLESWKEQEGEGYGNPLSLAGAAKLHLRILGS
jgi:hypothetical protein